MPQDWLVGPPPSAVSALTLPEDHWIDLAFSGRIVDCRRQRICSFSNPGRCRRAGPVFLTDGADQEYVVALTEADWNHRAGSHPDRDRSGWQSGCPFVARGVRIVGSGFGRRLARLRPGNVQARVSHDCGAEGLLPQSRQRAPEVSPYVRAELDPGMRGRQTADLLAARWNRRSDPRRPVHCWRLSRPRQTASSRGRVGPRPIIGVWTPPRRRMPISFTPGDVWSFTVADHLVVDNFEAYDLTSTSCRTWQSRGLGRGVYRGRRSSGCDQSMHFHYHYERHVGSPTCSAGSSRRRTGRTRSQRSCRSCCVATCRNRPRATDVHRPHRRPRTNRSCPMPAIWSIWPTARTGMPGESRLADFNSIDLANVRAWRLAFVPHDESAGPGIGTILLDDVILHPASVCYPAQCAPRIAAPGGPERRLRRGLPGRGADWRPTGCVTRIRSYAVAEPNEPVLWYDFDGNAKDSAGTAHGQIHGRCHFVPGVYGQAIRLHLARATASPSRTPRRVFARHQGGNHDCVLAMRRRLDAPERHDLLLELHLRQVEPGPLDPPRLLAESGPVSLGLRLSLVLRQPPGRPAPRQERVDRPLESLGLHEGHPPSASDGQQGPHGRSISMASCMTAAPGTDSPITNITSFEIGSGWYGRYDGLIDDFRIYDYALSPAEAAQVATRGTGTFEDLAPPRRPERRRPRRPPRLRHPGHPVAPRHPLAVVATSPCSVDDASAPNV